MAVVSAREILLDATSGEYAVGAFNIANIIQMEAVVEAARSHVLDIEQERTVSGTRNQAVLIQGAVRAILS